MQRGQVYRSEEVGIAYDEWYSELPKDARLLWYTLKNSRDMTACGLVKVAMGTLCFETAMTRDEVLAAIEAISQPFKSNGGDDYSRVVYWPRYDTFWIHNFYRKQRANTNPTNFDTSARKSLAQFPEVVQSCVLDTYPMLGNPIPIPLTSHPYPILDGSGIPSSISNKESVNSISTEVEIGVPAQENQIGFGDLDELFEEFWEAYPDRKGRKAGPKDDIKTAFAHFPTKDWSLLVTCARNYRAWCADADEYAVDPIRFFKSKDHPRGLWRDYQEPVLVTEKLVNGHGRASSRAQAPKSMADPEIAEKYKPGGKYGFLRQDRKGSEA